MTGTVTNDETGIVLIKVSGTVATTAVGTELGTFDQLITTMLGEPGTVATTDDETVETQSAGTTTGEYHVAGTVIATEIDGTESGTGVARPVKMDSHNLSVAPLNSTFGVARIS